MPMATTSFRLSADDRAALDAAAADAGLGPSSFARAATLAAAGRRADVRRKPDGTAAAVMQMLGQVAKIGNNANQLTRYAHQGGHVPPMELSSVQRQLERLTAAVLALREPRG